jgi:hypothetical protein
MDLVFDPQAAVKIEKVDAAAQQDVLAIVDGLGVFTRADLVGSRPAAQKSPRFQNPDRMPSAAQSRRGCQTRQASAQDDYLCHAEPCRGNIKCYVCTTSRLHVVLYDGNAAAPSAARIPVDEIEHHQHDQNDE